MEVHCNSSGDIFRFNSATGDYLYSRCGNGYTLTGTGSLSIRGSIYTLTHNPSDRRVLARLDDAVHSGTASVQVFALGTTFTITDRNTTNDPGLTDTSPPQVGITGPNGGEIVDRGSIFTISWNATDNVAVTSQDLLLSTDGGVTFSTIVAGLAGNVNQYAWTAPAGINNQSARVKVIARDAGCNVSADVSDANFTLWNPASTFTHVAEARRSMSRLEASTRPLTSATSLRARRQSSLISTSRAAMRRQMLQPRSPWLPERRALST